MKLANQLSEIGYEKNTVVTIGSFDGMHRAHREILRQVVDRARNRKGRSVLITFEPHPREVVGNHLGVPILTTLAEKQELASQWGVDVFYTIPFDYAFSRLSAREFYLRYLVQGTGVSEVIEGLDHHFGRDREGSLQDVRNLGKEFDYSCVAVDPVVVDGGVVSSTSIREYLLQGDVQRASMSLGRSYSLDGEVVRGDLRGRTLGFPTANVQALSSKKIVPKNGIYFVRVSLEKERLFGIASVGVRPTFKNDGQRVLEVYILNFQRDVYGETVRVSFEKRLRDEIKFGSAEELIRQMNRDKQECLQLQEQFSEQV